MEFFLYQIVDTYQYEEQSEFLDIIDIIRTTHKNAEEFINADLDQVIFYINLN